MKSCITIPELKLLLKVTRNSFHHLLLMGHYSHALSFATIMVSTNYLIISEYVIIFMNQWVSIATVYPAKRLFITALLVHDLKQAE